MVGLRLLRTVRREGNAMTSEALLSPAVPKPGHVCDSRVFDFDMFSDPAYIANPHARLLDLLQNAPPIFWTPRNGGHWIFLDYASNFDAARDTDTFSSEMWPRALIAEFMATLPPGTPRIPQTIPVSVDPPEHGKYRLPLQRVFSPRVIHNLSQDIRTLANQLIDNFIARGECEFMSEIAEPLPVQIFLKMMGLPLDRQGEYRVLVQEQLADRCDNAEKVIARMQQIVASMRETMLERRENPQEDIISLLWKTEIDGRPMTLEEVEDYCLLLFIAGLDTVMNGMGHGVHHLARDQQLQQQLRDNPQLIPDAVEELMRRYTFVVPVRRVTRDTVFNGVTLLENEQVKLFLPAADLDDREFADASTFDLKRENKVHIAFNAGPHRCLGSHLARLELQILYEQMLARLPAFRLDSKRVPVFHCGPIIGVDSLHLVWK
jgi:cytochrome P450